LGITVIEKKINIGGGKRKGSRKDGNRAVKVRMGTKCSNVGNTRGRVQNMKDPENCEKAD